MHDEPTPWRSAGPGGPRIPQGAPDDLRDVDFPVAFRGYDQRAVDDYVVEVNRLIAELEATRTPEAVVNRALDRVGEETAGILQRARETADEITARSRSQADDRLEQADREAQAVREEAEARARQLEDEMNALMDERARLMAEVRLVAERLVEVADSADAEVAREQTTEDRGTVGEDAGDETREIDAVRVSELDAEKRPPEDRPEYRPE